MEAAMALRVPIAPQSPHAHFEPASIGRPDRSRSTQEEDVTTLLDRKAPKDRQLVLRDGKRIGTLRSLIQGIIEMDEGEFGELLVGGSLSEFARSGLGSPSLESILDSVAQGRSGPEDPSVARERFMRWVLESPMSVIVVREIATPMIKRLMNCSVQESKRLSALLSPIMDERSAPTLVDLLFKVPAPNRSAVIALLARTGSQLAIGPLEKLRDMSSVESDRTESARALEQMGVRTGKDR
jgi:hypothetical protein